MSRTNGNIYRDYRKGKQKKTRKSFSFTMLLFLVDIIMVVALLLLAAATIICCITPNIAPERLGIFSVVVLGAPIIYILQLIVLLYWAVRWKWSLACVTLIFVVISTLNIGGYYRMSFKQKAEGKYSSRNTIKVISYNIANSNTQSLIDTLALHTPTILCLQEYNPGEEELWTRLGSKYTTTANGKGDFSCEIFTNRRILKQGLIDSLPRHNAIWADILVDKDTIRVVNIHLQSTSITAQDIKFVEAHQYMTDSARSSKIKVISDKLIENNIYRSNQARKVREFIYRSAQPKIIVCGDFNDVPLSFSYNAIAEPLNSAFVAAGSGYSHTFNGFFKLLQIDHLLASDHFDILTYEVDYTMGESDHYPVISRLKINRENK